MTAGLKFLDRIVHTFRRGPGSLDRPDYPRDAIDDEELSVTDLGNTVPIQRVQAFAELAANRGWDADELMRAAGMSPMLLSRGRSRVTAAQASALIQQLLRVTDDELLGLGSAPVPRGTLVLLGYALLGSVDLHEALTRLAKVQRAVPGIPPIHLGRDGSSTANIALRIDISRITRPLDVLIDTMLAAIHRTLGWATRSRIRLVRVDIPHPHQVGVDDYDIIFGSPIVFAAAQPALVFPTAVLSAPIMREPDEWEGFLRNAPELILSRRDYAVSLADRVRRVVGQGLNGQWPSADEVAERLAMSQETLRRKLRGENTSLTKIREDLLRDTAVVALADGQETIAALSSRLGFSEPSAFTRAFRRWTGSSPSTYRVNSRD
jgi:AraC-like DNA-binding protein